MNKCTYKNLDVFKDIIKKIAVDLSNSINDEKLQKNVL